MYVLFIDFSKAYDRVPREKLIKHLKKLKAMYTDTRNVLKSGLIDASIGVRQGAPYGCLLFTIYIDQMIKMLKGEISRDVFLSDLHSLLLMDDIDG